MCCYVASQIQSWTETNNIIECTNGQWMQILHVWDILTASDFCIAVIPGIPGDKWSRHPHPHITYIRQAALTHRHTCNAKHHMCSHMSTIKPQVRTTLNLLHTLNDREGTDLRDSPTKRLTNTITANGRIPGLLFLTANSYTRPFCCHISTFPKCGMFSKTLIHM